jgi:hypothetical protein
MAFASYLCIFTIKQNRYKDIGVRSRVEMLQLSQSCTALPPLAPLSQRSNIVALAQDIKMTNIAAPRVQRFQVKMIAVFMSRRSLILVLPARSRSQCAAPSLE